MHSAYHFRNSFRAPIDTNAWNINDKEEQRKRDMWMRKDSVCGRNFPSRVAAKILLDQSVETFV